MDRRTLLSLPLMAGCGRRQRSDSEVRRLVYWDKWTGFEGEAMDAVVDGFNARERQRAAAERGYRPIEVERVTVSNIEQKLLVAVAGREPPDVAGTYGYAIADYADKGALTDLTSRLRGSGIDREAYIPLYFDLNVHRGRTWGVPTTPASIALHWNKRLFREAGLDPDRAPRTIEELDQFAERLTVWEVTRGATRRIERGYASDVPPHRKRLLQIGFIHSNPIWWPYIWGEFFGGKLVQGTRVTIDSPENLRAYEWIASRSRRLGVEPMQRFQSGFGKFSTPQNPFLQNKIAMQMQGVWMYNFIEKYAPGLQWGVAPFPPPADRPDRANTTLGETDVLVIPRDAARPDEAFEFIRYVSTPAVLEELTLGQRKFSPLLRVSEAFWRRHPHPHIALFQALGTSKNAFTVPKVSVWNQYLRELRSAVDAIDNLSVSVPRALGHVRQRLQAAVDREERAYARRAAG